MARSACPLMTVLALAVLFAGVRSVVVEETLPLSVIVPLIAGAVALRVMLVLPPEMSVERLQVAVEPLIVQPGALEIVPLLRVSASVGVVDESGPKFETVA